MLRCGVDLCLPRPFCLGWSAGITYGGTWPSLGIHPPLDLVEKMNSALMSVAPADLNKVCTTSLSRYKYIPIMGKGLTAELPVIGDPMLASPL